MKLPTGSEAKREFLFELYYKYKDLGKSQRCKQLAEDTGLSESGFYRYAQKYGWDARIAAIQIEKNSNVVKESASEISRKGESVAFSEVVNTIKDFSFMMLETSRDMATTAAVMIRYHSSQISKIIMDAGGPNYLTHFQKTEIEVHADHVREYKKQIGEYMHPANISKYFSLVGIQDAIGKIPDGIDEQAFTPAAVQKLLREQGLMSAVANEEQIEKIEASIGNMVEINARKVVDEKNDINVEKAERFKKYR